MLEYAVNDVDPSLSFELIEHIAVVVVEHELFISPSSGKKRQRVAGESGGSRMLQDNLWDVLEEVPTRHFKFDVTLQEPMPIPKTVPVPDSESSKEDREAGFQYMSLMESMLQPYFTYEHQLSKAAALTPGGHLGGHHRLLVVLLLVPLEVRR
eukprot:jgi/Tetstr1/457490/TSEL_044072.t1